MTIFFTSDHHFGHANIIKYCDRPFASVDIMDTEMIRRWNTVVRSSDTVVHLGDFTLGNREMAEHYLSQLNGQISILSNPWHHDKRWLPKNSGAIQTKDGPLTILETMVIYDVPDVGDIVLCHYPILEWDRKHYGILHFHGHSHGKARYPDGCGVLDVGVDVHDFYPITVKQAVNIIADKKIVAVSQ